MKIKSRNHRPFMLPERVPFVLVAFLMITILTPISRTDAQTQTPLNDTGFTKCGDYAYDGGSDNHNNDIDCSLTTDANGDPVPHRQDGHYGRDVTDSNDDDGRAGFSFTKIDGNGNSLPASATSWMCVLDNVTGLMWEVKTDDDALRDNAWTYSWYNSNTYTNGGYAGASNGGWCSSLWINNNFCDTEKYAERVNDGGLCGHHDWRLPGREELRSIVDYSVLKPNIAIDTDWFPNTNPTFWYWSASTYASDSYRAWGQDFANDWFKTSLPYYKWSSSGKVRLVRDL